MGNSNHNLHGSYLDDWETHKEDLLWRRFWYLWELRRKWKWADWFYRRLDRCQGDVVEPTAWTLSPGENYMKLGLWIALLRSVHEGLTDTLPPEPTNTCEKQRVKITQVFPSIPTNISNFPSSPGSPFRDFRNAILHCQWSPTVEKLNLDENTTKELEALHEKIGDWLNSNFHICHGEFKKHYRVPDYWIYNPDGTEFMPEAFY